MPTPNRPPDVLDLPSGIAAPQACEAILLTDERQVIVAVDPAALRMFRCTADDALGSPLARFLPRRLRAMHAARVRSATASAAAGPAAARHRVTGLRADGEEFPLEITLSPVEMTADEGPGRRRGFAVLMRDLGEPDLHADDLRRLSASVVEAREEERRRIARELHDELGQRLTALKMDVSGLAAERGGPDARIAGMLSMLDETVASVRRIAADLRPLMLDDLGLDAAVEWLASEASRRLGIEVRVQLVDTEPAPDERVAIALYRMVQEALTNVGRHARATEVRIELRHEAGELVLTVRDDGIGISEHALHREGSFGLLGMQERARMLGGRFEIASPPGGGGLVTIRLPLRPPPGPEVPGDPSHPREMP